MVLDTSFIKSWVKDGVQYGPPPSKDELNTSNFFSILNSSFSFYHNVNHLFEDEYAETLVIFLPHLLTSFTMTEIIYDNLIIMENKIQEIKQKIIDSPTKIEDLTSIFDNDMRYFEIATFLTDDKSLIKTYDQVYESFLNNYENGQTKNKNTLLEEFVEAQFIDDTQENRTKLSNLLDKSKVELHNEHQVNKEKAYALLDILQEILEINEQKSQNDTDNTIVDQEETLDNTLSSSGQENIQNNFVKENQMSTTQNTADTNQYEKEFKMPTLTSSQEYTTLKTELNKTISNFVKRHPESVKYSKLDSNKSQITLLFGQTRDVEMKRFAQICMDSVNDNDFDIDGIPMDVVKASESYVVFEGETAAVETAIKTKANDYPILAVQTSQTEDFDVDDLVNKIKDTIILSLVQNRGTLINYSYLFNNSGIEVIDSRDTGKIIINLDRLEKFLKMMESRGTLSVDDVAEGDPGYEYAAILKVVNAVRDVTLSVLRMKNRNKELLIGDFTKKLEVEKLGLERVNEDSVTFTYDVETYSELREWFPIDTEVNNGPAEDTEDGPETTQTGDQDPSGDQSQTSDSEDSSETTQPGDSEDGPETTQTGDQDPAEDETT